MSEVASWLKGEGKIWFNTDADVIKYERKQGTLVSSIDWDDWVGHNGVLKIFRYDCPMLEGAHHWEGFRQMPPIVKKAYLDGRCDRIFCAGDNLWQATLEFVPMMARLFKQSLKVTTALFLRRDCPREVKPELIKHMIIGEGNWNELLNAVSISEVMKSQDCTLPLLKHIVKERHSKFELEPKDFRELARNPNGTPEFLISTYEEIQTDDNKEEFLKGIQDRGYKFTIHLAKSGKGRKRK